jgi:thioredoxin reductase
MTDNMLPEEVIPRGSRIILMTLHFCIRTDSGRSSNVKYAVITLGTGNFWIKCKGTTLSILSVILY